VLFWALPADWPRIRARVLRRDGNRCTHRDQYGERCEELATDVDHIVCLVMTIEKPTFECSAGFITRPNRRTRARSRWPQTGGAWIAGSAGPRGTRPSVNRRGSIAQLVERRSPKPVGGGGSSPSACMDIWSWLRVGWLGAFGAIDGVAIARDGRGDTLSEHVWKWFGIGRHDESRPAVTGTVRLRRFVLLAVCAWLLAHFLTGGVF
jgi:hypothetical protein